MFLQGLRTMTLNLGGKKCNGGPAVYIYKYHYNVGIFISFKPLEINKTTEYLEIGQIEGN